VGRILALGVLMALGADDQLVDRLVAVALRSVGGFELEGVFTARHTWRATNGALRGPLQQTEVASQLAALASTGGRLPDGDRARWAFPLTGPDGCLGYIVVGANGELSGAHQFLVRLVVQQAAAGLVHARQREMADHLDHTRAALADATGLLDWNRAVRMRMDQIVTTGGGAHDIAVAVHDLTGHTVAIEDSDGNLTAWAGPVKPPRRTRAAAERRQRIAQALRIRRPIHEPDRLVVVAHRKDRLVGLLSLIDPIYDIGEREILALESGATLLALALDHVHELAEVEARLGRDLMAELLDSNADPAVVERAQALGFDVNRGHRVVMVQSTPACEPGVFFHAVRRAARDTGFGAWLTPHGHGVALVTDAGPPWEPLHRAIIDESGVASCRLGVGAKYRDQAGLRMSLRQAGLAVAIHAVVGEPDVVEFEQLGIYRLLADIAESTDLERYVATWLRPLEALLAYDAVHHSQLVATLSAYLESGGHHHPAAQALNVHPSTLKYRLQRIHEITGCDLTDPDTRFDLQLSTRAWQTMVSLHARRTS
jgi:hypothetical protein